jgi:hypothetical protein
MITNYLFVNGGAEVGIDHESKQYYVDASIVDSNNWDYFMEVSKEELLEILETKFNWIPEGWDKNLAAEYNELLEVVKNG